MPSAIMDTYNRLSVSFTHGVGIHLYDDTGERYLAAPLFEDIEVDMDADETEISRSTPNYQFG